VKNVGGMDTVGFCLDRQIISRVQAEFEKDVGPERATEYMNISEGKPVAVDFNDTYDQWWTSQVGHITPHFFLFPW
jgi:outer membrane protein assembly factor BamB